MRSTFVPTAFLLLLIQSGMALADDQPSTAKLPIAPGGYFEEPQPPYQGVVTGIFAPGGVAHSDGVVACENYLP